MSKKNKKTNGGNVVSEGRNGGFIELDPSEIRFTHARIRPFFSGCGRLIMNTLDDIVSKRIPLENLPMITVISNNGFYFSLNNRRLFVLKTLRDQGYLVDRGNKVRVRTKAPLPREVERYTIERCCLQAKLMPSHNKGASDATEGDDDGDEDEVDNGEV